MARKNYYPEVKTLPEGAMTVRTYCDWRGWPNVTTFYKYWGSGKITDRTIVLFQGFNYVIPINNVLTN